MATWPARRRPKSSARDALTVLRAADDADRTRLSEAERAATTAREHLRAADERLRAADHAELEARLGLDSLREGVLVELAGMGRLGLASLGVRDEHRRSVRTPTPTDRIRTRMATRSTRTPPPLERALATVAGRWAAEPPAVAAAVPWPARAAAPPLPRARGRESVSRSTSTRSSRPGSRPSRRRSSDLRSAIGRTRELIAELDTMIADQFRTTFLALETAFERRFEQLFGGGFARLSLTDPTDLGSTGVEIVARPPGKKAQALAMLSGGERALTAVALLFAMLEVRPVPFCVLDEVDAALDEANIDRFADALRSLAHQTQFIVITHNRGTIEAADALYGVTVGDDSVSRVDQPAARGGPGAGGRAGRELSVAG